MSNEINTGGPAFPSEEVTLEGTEYITAQKRYSEGMTLRDYFAAKALVGFLVGQPDADCGPVGYAFDAYMQADAMIHARETKS